MSETAVSAELLEALLPVKELDSRNRFALAERGQFMDFAPGEQLVAAKEHGWLLYLLQGQAQLSADGKEFALVAATPRAAHPLFTAGRLRDSVMFSSPSRVLRLDRKLFDILRKSQSRCGYQVEDVELTEAEGAIFHEIYRACTEGKLDLPALPEVALKIQSALKDPNMDIAKLARIIEIDLAVTGGLLRAANSALYGGKRPVNNIRDAVVRLGMTIARRLVMTVAMRQVFRGGSPRIRARLQALWERSVRVSVLSYVLARLPPGGGLDPERALLLGLLHAVGAVPILDYLARHYPDLDDTEIDAVVDKLKGLVGEIVIGYWGMGADINQLVRHSGNWWCDQDTGKPDYLDVVIVAELYHLNLTQPDLPVPRYTDIPAFGRLGLGVPDADLRLPELEQALQDAEELTHLLQDLGAAK